MPTGEECRRRGRRAAGPGRRLSPPSRSRERSELARPRQSWMPPATQPSPTQWGTPTADPPRTRRTASRRRCRSRQQQHEPRSRPPGWVLAGGLRPRAGRSASSAARSAALLIERLTDDTPGLVARRSRRRRHRLRRAAPGRQRLGRRGRRRSCSRARCRSPPSTKARRAAPPAPGFVLDKQGHIITNNHVVADAAEDDGPIEIVDQDGNRYDADGRRPQPGLRPRRALRPPTPAACSPAVARRLAGAARRRRASSRSARRSA